MGRGLGGLASVMRPLLGLLSGTGPSRLHADDAAYLIAPLFDRLSSLFVGHAAPLALCIFVIWHTEAEWPLLFLALDLVLMFARLLVILSIRRRQRPSSAELLRAARPYFAIGVAWAASTGAFCFLCYVVLEDEASRMLAVTLAMGPAGCPPVAWPRVERAATPDLRAAWPGAGH